MTMQIEIKSKDCKTYDLSQAPLWEPLEVIEATQTDFCRPGDIVVAVQDACCYRYVLVKDGFGTTPVLHNPNYKLIFKRPNEKCEVKFVND